MKYFKLLTLNVIVASILALALTGTSKADGVDDPKFYNVPSETAPKHARKYGQVFDWCMSSRFNNMSSRCRQFDDMGPFNWPNEIIDIPSTVVVVPNQPPAQVPEPTTIIILLWSLALVYGYKKVLK